MTDPGRDRTWTLILLRSGGGRVFEWTGSRRVAGAALAAVLSVAVAAGAGLGLAWAERHEDRRVSELRERVERLRRERSKVRRLAARLDSVERAYRRIRSVMGGGPEGARGDVALPPGPAEEEPAGRDGAAPGGSRRSADGWTWPLAQEGFVTRTHREGRAEGGGEHRGLDVAVPVGSYVRAARTGVVEGAGEDEVFGRFVRLRHGDGSSSLYGHNRWLFVSEGDSVEAGEVIALSGNSGRSTAPHLHFEIIRDDQSVDPERVLGEVMPREALADDDTGGGAP